MDNFARPLRRRLASTFLPEGVVERTRNPCVVARFLLLGLYVCDMITPLYTIFPKTQAA
jgi:hypothetical protein